MRPFADLACGGILFLFAALLALVCFWALRGYLRLGETMRREHEEIQRSALQDADANLDSVLAEHYTYNWLWIQAKFPFLPTPVIKDTSPEAIDHGIRQVLRSVPSLGTFGEMSLPAPLLPQRERQRHLYVVGKSGSGKTTFLEHLIERDLKAGRGVCVIGPEGELFRERLLPLVPEFRRGQVIYYAPGHPENPLSFNPLFVADGEDKTRAAQDLFTIFKRSLGEDGLGARMRPILQNAFALLTGLPGMTLWDVRRLLEDREFRQDLALACEDEYVREFWLGTYPRYPKGSDLPIISRLDQFLRPTAIRKTLCQRESSFSVREILAAGDIFFVDLFGLSEDSRLLVGQMLLSKFQLELMRRELSGKKHQPYFLFADEFQSFAGMAEGTWRELLSRGRKYGLCLTLANQYPGQLPRGLQDEIFGNCNSVVTFALGAKDAGLIRKEFLILDKSKEEASIGPVRTEDIMELPTGMAWAKYAGGRGFLLKVPEPLKTGGVEVGQRIVEESWRIHGSRLSKERPSEVASRPQEPESFLE